MQSRILSAGYGHFDLAISGIHVGSHSPNGNMLRDFSSATDFLWIYFDPFSYDVQSCTFACLFFSAAGSKNPGSKIKDTLLYSHSKINLSSLNPCLSSEDADRKLWTNDELREDIVRDRPGDSASGTGKSSFDRRRNRKKTSGAPCGNRLHDPKSLCRKEEAKYLS